MSQAVLGDIIALSHGTDTALPPQITYVCPPLVKILTFRGHVQVRTRDTTTDKIRLSKIQKEKDPLVGNSGKSFINFADY